jgi:glycosyltransferase involved in cell wall biosynthesis
MKDQAQTLLFITDKRFVDYNIGGGVQLCTNEFLAYFETAGYRVNIFKVDPSTSFITKVKNKLGIEAYEIYNVDKWLTGIVDTINKNGIKLVLFNQLNLAYWAIKIKKEIAADVKFVGLSHGNESGDYLHEITQTNKTSILKTWRLGRLLTKEKILFSKILNGIITISDHETLIDQWLGAGHVFFLPRILKPGFIKWQPQPKTIGFVGTLDHLPNLLGIQYLADQLQLENFEGLFKLVGGPAEKGHEFEKKYSFIQYCGILNNEQLITEAGTWSIFLNPVFYYARGSTTKLSQGINWGIPVLTTPAGLRGYDVSNNAIVVADNSPKTLSKMIIQVLDSPVLLQQLKKASSDNASNFNIDHWAAKLPAFFNSL